MSAISLKSITGITSITTPAGVDNQLTLHNNNTTEAVKLDIAGNVHINNHLAVAGITTINGGKLAIGNVVPSKMLELYSGSTVASMYESAGAAYVEQQFKNSSRHYILGIRPETSHAFCIMDNSSGSGGVLLKASGHTVTLDHDLNVDGHTNLDNVSIAGVTTTTENIHIKADNKQLKIGAHNDGDTLLYHDGNKSVLVNYTGDFHIRTNNGSRSSLEGIILKPNGATEIYHSGSKVFETDSLGINVDGRLDVVGTGANDHLNVGTNTGRLRIGGYADLQLYHDSTNINYISNHNDIDLHITSTYGGSPVKTQAKFIHNGAVELYHNNDLRLQTWSDAVNILGDEGEDAILHLYADEGDNNEDKWMLRAESSAQRFSIENYSSGSWVENIRITAGNMVELKHADGTTKFQTTSTGVSVTNRITAGGDSNTYMNLGPNDIIDLYTGGTNLIRMDANGNLGINDTDPPNFTGYKSLSIHGSTGGALVFGDDGTDEWETYGGDGVFKIYDRAATTTRLHLDGSYGRFGINTNSFSDTSTALSLRNGVSGNDHTILDIICNDNQTARLTFSEDSNSSKGSIRYYYTGDANYMSFYTNGGASTNERLRINSNGAVNIGGEYTNTTHKFLVDNGTSYFKSRVYVRGSLSFMSTPFGANVTYDTGISVNAAGYGGSMLCLCSRNYGAGTSTQAALYFLKFNYDGNHTPGVYYITGTNNFATFGKSGSNTLTVAMGASNNMFTVIESSVS